MKWRGLIIGVIALVGCASCDVYDPNKYTVGPGSVDSILAFSASATSVPADGISSTLLTVQIDPKSSKRDVQFTATDGSFTVGVQGDTRKASVTADLSGKAVTELRSTTTVGTVTVDAAIQVDATQTIRRSLELRFVPPGVEDVLALTSASPTIPADGFSRVVITATLKLTGGNGAQRQVDFKSSEGLLYAAGKAAAAEQVVAVASDGTAFVELESTKNLRDAIVSATVAGVTRQLVVRHAVVDPSSIITVAPSAATAPADGASTTLITAHVSPGLPAGRRDVTFVAAPAATLSRTTATADSSNRASTTLQSPRTTGVIRITATVDGTSDETSVQFVPALPDRILLSASKPSVAANASDSVIITATLQRDEGFVTTGTNVVFTATDSTGAAFGTFANNSVSNESGTATATFFPGAGATHGPATITARVPNAAAAGTVRVVVTP